MTTLNQLIEQMEWINPPKKAKYDASQERVTLTTKLNTDFWQQTHYKFQRDDGHIFAIKARGNFCLSVKMTLKATNRYDQGGLILREDSGNWLKTSLEYIPDGPNKLGSVQTTNGFSDWAIQETDESNECYFRLIRIDQDVYVACSQDGEDWQTIRMCHVEGGAQVGLYACSPQGEDLDVTFSELTFFEGIRDRTQAYR